MVRQRAKTHLKTEAPPRAYPQAGFPRVCVLNDCVQASNATSRVISLLALCRTVDFYPGGEWAYKGLFGTDSLQGTGVLLLRKTLGNRVRVGGHAALRSLVGVARRLLKADETSRVDEEDS
jgi:hypothetical protein